MSLTAPRYSSNSKTSPARLFQPPTRRRIVSIWTFGGIRTARATAHDPSRAAWPRAADPTAWLSGRDSAGRGSTAAATISSRPHAELVEITSHAG